MIQEIIHKYNNKNSLYGNKLTNHLNMGLYALYEMGASEKQLESFASGYIKHNKLQPLEAIKVVIDDHNYDDYLGIDGYYSSYIPYFMDILEDATIDVVVSRFLNEFLDGSAGGAFHGLIRLAYAYELKDKEEVAKALAYMAECYKQFPKTEKMKKAKVLEPIQGFLKLSNNEHFQSKKFNRALIIGRMEDIYEDPIFAKEIFNIDKSYCTSDYFGELLLQLYAMTEDFTVLHGFTSTHALRVLSPLIHHYDEVLALHFYHLQLAYLSTNCTEIKEIPSVEKLLNWNEIFALVIPLKDIHTVKIVYSLFEQSKFSKKDELHRTLAQIKIKHSY